MDNLELTESELRQLFDAVQERDMKELSRVNAELREILSAARTALTYRPVYRMDSDDWA
jgi:CRISPR/Cas system CSM-associated protein Csm2 small subunit